MADYMEFFLKLRKLKYNIPIEVNNARNDFFSHDNKADYLYIYYDVNTISQIANETNELWFKSANAFTDKEEHLGWINKFACIYMRLDSKNFSRYNDVFKKIVKNAFDTYDIEKYNRRYYICCTSYEPDNNLCWNTFMGNSVQHITKINVKGKCEVSPLSEEDILIIGNDLSCSFEKKYTHGACVCFNKSSFDLEFQYDSNPLKIIGGFVCYSSNILNSKFEDCLDSVYKLYLEDNNENSVIIKIHEMIDYCNLFYKNNYYSGEKEFRYVYDSLLENNQELSILSKEIIKNKIIYKYKFKKDLIDHITITNSNDKSMFETNFKDKIYLSKISFNEENINWYDIGLIYED